MEMEFEHDWVFETEQEIQDEFESNSKRLHNLIVDITIENIDSKKTIPIVTIHAKDTRQIFDIYCEPDHMLETLEQNLEIMEGFEDYERCQKILESINYLKLKSSL
jgi:hypothetical protein